MKLQAISQRLWLLILACSAGLGSGAELRFRHHYIHRALPVSAQLVGDYGLTALVDVDRDGDLDLIALNKGDPNDTTGPIRDGPLLVYLNTRLARADESPPRIGQHAAYLGSAGQHALARTAQKVFEFGGNRGFARHCAGS